MLILIMFLNLKSESTVDGSFLVIKFTRVFLICGRVLSTYKCATDQSKEKSKEAAF